MALATPRVKYVGNIPVNIADLNNSLERPIHIPQLSAASGSQGEIFLTKVDSSRPVLSLYQVALIPLAVMTNNTSNYVTAQLFNRGVDGTGTSVIASLTTNAASGTVPAYVETLMTIDFTQAAIVPGSVLTMKFTGTGTGLLVPYSAVILRFNQ
jgi:hypothetical protein